jgi:hypothetical protein
MHAGVQAQHAQHAAPSEGRLPVVHRYELHSPGLRRRIARVANAKQSVEGRTYLVRGLLRLASAVLG